MVGTRRLAVRGWSGLLVLWGVAGCTSAGTIAPIGDGLVPAEDVDSGVDDTASGAEDGGRRAFPDGEVWSGTRRFAYESFDAGYVCEATVAAHGARVDAGEDPWDALVEACPRCDAFHRVESERHEVCDWLALPESAWRGLHRGSDGLEVVVIEGDADAPVVRATARATVDGATLRYAYALRGPEGLEVEVVGDMTFHDETVDDDSEEARER
jgi:hypothetical protein